MKTHKGYWTKEKCIDVSNNCNNRKEFRKKYKSAYTACYRNGWLNDIIGTSYKPRGYWTKEKCHEYALKYKTKKEFKNSYPYRIALKNKWIDDICGHMIVMGNKTKRCIYVYEFDDNSAYIGLTFNVNYRKKEHIKSGPIHKHIYETNSFFNFKKLTNYIDIEKAKELENIYIEKYNKKGWNILNKIKGGGIGGIKKWDFETCQIEALKYKTKKEFKKNNRGAHSAASRNGWMEKITSHMIQTKKPKGYWTKEKCHDEALKYKTRNDFFKGSSGVYNISRRNKWLDSICSHMTNKKYKKKNYWTKERCHDEALKYKTRKEFKQNNSSAYSISSNNKWLNEITSHMK
jgi:hypothetical protein